MGERKGQNHYYPPDYDPKVGSLNKWQGTHALRERARKIHLGIIIIRFEMPYNIWCDGCKNHIGMGVRYNAEKTKVGMYYSTPIYQFRMKCHLCDNHFEIKTDPANLDYVIVTGARRQENRWDPTQNEQIVPETKEVQKKLFDDPMYKLEHGAKDTKAAEDAKPVLGQLYQRNSGVWRDDFEANSRLRAEFRASKKQTKQQDEKDKALLAKSSLDISLLPESESDRKMASLMRLHSAKSIAERDREKRSTILTRPALPSTSGVGESSAQKVKIAGAKLEMKSLGIVKKTAASPALVLASGSKRKVEETIVEEKKPKLLLCNYGSGSSDSD
ncbi:hypothetical protein quinque_011787 [Culex quinquefasciatus]|uniref:coiled-coil domain-containing protein 130 homolog n=1 Tax=Culex quinquefasciatus TaxID=7176 RepID=UPI0018E368EB|nr:coiled-coil domain-containing protein 130 homolog [Culex quinquefasciatus]